MLQTSTYTFRDTEELIAYQEGRYGSYEYGRYGNPTTRAVEEKIRVRRWLTGSRGLGKHFLGSRVWEKVRVMEWMD